MKKIEQKYLIGNSLPISNTHFLAPIPEPKRNIFGIGFGMANHISKIKSQKSFDLIYTVDENEFKGMVSLQLKVKDLKV